MKESSLQPKRMSEDRRKNLRTQGKYSDGKVQKGRDKKQRSSFGSKDSLETRFTNRNSDGNKNGNNSSFDESPPSVKYEEKSSYTFRQLEEVAKPTEIKDQGEFILSETDNGKSRILYEPRFLFEDEADNYFDQLRETVNFDSRNIVIHGVEYPQPRLVAWFGPFPYSYSGTTLEAAEMPDVVLEIKEKVERFLKSRNIEATFNSVLINLYRDGKDSVAWHSDDELTLGICPTIASVSLGEVRRFEIRPKTKNYDDKSPSDSTCQYLLRLLHGSLVIMTGCMQEDFQHRVPKEYHDKGPRINLTFRTVYPLEKAAEHNPVRETNLERANMPCGCNGSGASSKYRYKHGDEHFPSLQKDIASVKSVTCDTNDNVDEESWDNEISHNEHNIESGVTNKNTCPVFNNRGEDFKPRNNVRNKFNNEKPPEKQQNIEPNCDNEKNPLNDKISTKKLWYRDYDSSVNDTLENDTVDEKIGVKCNKSAMNSSVNENKGNKFYEKTDQRKIYVKETSLTGKTSQQNISNQEECSVKSYNIKTNSYLNVNQENHMDNEEALSAYHDVKSNSWDDSCDESNLEKKKVTKMPLSAEAKVFNNAYISVTQESDLGNVKPPSACHYVESNSWKNSLEENDLGGKQSQKTSLNVDAKEFVPHSIIPNEMSQFSELELEDLINCNLISLQGKDLQDHAQFLKMRIFERFDEIHRFDKKEMEFLLEITDGSQTDKNQKLITQQICKVVQDNFSRIRQPLNVPSSDRGFKTRGYSNQGYFPDKGRRHPTQNRNSKPIWNSRY